MCEVLICKYGDFRLLTQFIVQRDFLQKIIETSHTVTAATQYVILYEQIAVPKYTCHPVMLQSLPI